MKTLTKYQKQIGAELDFLRSLCAIKNNMSLSRLKEIQETISMEIKRRGDEE